MTLSDLEFYLVEIGCVGQAPPVRSLLVRLVSDRGLEGWGEASSRWYPAELPARRRAVLPSLAGRSIFEIEELLGLAALRPMPLRAAVEMACWDLLGRTVRQPLCHLFGGGYRSRVPLAVRLTGATPHAVAQLAREFAEQGFHCQILPASGQWETDVETVQAAREVTSGRTELRLDAAAGYSRKVAWELCSELEGDRHQLVIDPLGEGDLDDLASLRRRTSVPLGVCRAIRSPADVLAVVRCGAVPLVIVDIERVGGILASRKCAVVAEAAGLSAALTSSPSLGVSMAAMLQVAASTPGFSSANESAYPHLQDDVLVEPFEIASGLAAVSLSPGLGIEVDRAKVERYQVT